MHAGPAETTNAHSTRSRAALPDGTADTVVLQSAQLQRVNNMGMVAVQQRVPGSLTHMITMNNTQWQCPSHAQSWASCIPPKMRVPAGSVACRLVSDLK